MSLRHINTSVIVIAAVCTFISQSVVAATFSVGLSISVSGVTSGSGSGSGSATLDTDSGVLTMNLNSTTVTGFTNTSVLTIATITGTYAADSLSGVSGSSQLISCTHNGGLVNGCGSVDSSFGTVFLSDPINFDLAPGGQTTFTVRDSNSGANIEQSFTLTTGGTVPVGPPATIDLTSGGPTQYTFDPGNNEFLSLVVTASSGSVTQGSSGLGNHTAFADDGALDNYAVGGSRETLTFTFSEPVVLDSVALDLFEPIGTSERAELSVDGGNTIVIDENNASRTGGDLSNWKYLVGTELTYFTIGSPQRTGIIGNTTFRVNSLVVSAVPVVDTDIDDDGLEDAVETNTGVFIDANNTGSSPSNSDTDGDGVLDGAEVASGSDPNISQRPCDIDSNPGLSAGDLLLLQRHLSDVQPLTSNQQIFCDVNEDASVSLTDLLMLQQQVLGQ